MKVKNIGGKIINVGSTILMPDDITVVPKAYCGTPALNAFIRLGLLEEVEEKKAAPDKGEAAPAPKKRGRAHSSEGKDEAEKKDEEATNDGADSSEDNTAAQE